MIFNVSELNHDVYVGIQIGTGKIAEMIKIISSYDLKAAYAKGVKIETANIASHIFILTRENNEWFVYESHAADIPKTAWKYIGSHHSGIRKHKLTDFDKICINSNETMTMQVFPFKLSLPKLNYYVEHNPGYGFKEIAALLIEAKTKGWVSLGNSDTGLICSEYAAECDYECNLSRQFDLPTWDIKPVHFQIWAHKNNIQPKEVAKYQAVKVIESDIEPANQ